MKSVLKNLLALSLCSMIVSSCGSVSGINSQSETVEANSWFNKPTPVVLSHSTVVTKNNNASLLVDRDQIFTEMYNIIDHAKKKIYITTYLFGDSIGHKIAEKLIAKKKEGVEIKFVAEETMGYLPQLVNPAEKEYKFLVANGVAVKFFPVELMPKGPTFLSNRKLINHSKMVVADESVAIIGGMNYKDSEAINHDYMVRIEGNAAKELSKIGDDNWEKSRPIRIGNSGNNLPVSTPEVPSLPVPVPASNSGSSMVEIAQTGFKEQSIGDMVIRYFNNAKRSISVEMLLMDNQEVVKALVRAKNRGVKVRIILDEIEFGKYNKIIDRIPLEGMANFGSVTSLIGAEIPVRWYVSRQKDSMLHAKAAMVDNQTLIVGSANFTYHALTRNHEVSIAVNNSNVANAFGKTFEQDWSVNSKPAQLTDAQKQIGKIFQKFFYLIYEDKTEEEILNEIRASNPVLNSLLSDGLFEN